MLSLAKGLENLAESRTKSSQTALLSSSPVTGSFHTRKYKCGKALYFWDPKPKWRAQRHLAEGGAKISYTTLTNQNIGLRTPTQGLKQSEILTSLD